MMPEHSKPNMNGALGRDSITPCRAIKSWKFKPLEKKIIGIINKNALKKQFRYNGFFLNIINYSN